jgi:hypothetical protein
MSWPIYLHDLIVKYNILRNPTDRIAEYFSRHPDLYKGALVVSHVVRAVPMIAFNITGPCSAPVNISLCFASSLFYRLAIESKSNCTYKIALPAFAGSIAIPIGVKALTSLAGGAAFRSLRAFSIALGFLVPLTAYLSYVVLTVSYDVDCGRIRF